MDPGGRPIKLYENSSNSNIAIIIIGGIHGDETETVDVVEYIKDKIQSKIKLYFIPSLNPTLINANKRGYMREHINKDGTLIPGSKLDNYNKGLYYRIFYGNNKTYKNGIDHYIDPNRDFFQKSLLSTVLLIKQLDKLKTFHEKVILLSFHGYMPGGRVYPEYIINSNKDIKIAPYTWKLAKVFASGSGFQSEKLYSPSIPIIERFQGELIAYTGKIDEIIAFDVELDNSNQHLNKSKSLYGLEALIKELDKK